MESVIDWDQALETIGTSNLPSLSLLRGVSDAFGSVADQEDTNDLDAALFEALEDVDDKPESPAAVSYASSDESSVQNSYSSSDFEDDKKKKRVVRKRTTAGLSAQEKRELRKLRNRELAAESRKRKNDEMERLRKENTDLKNRIVDLESKLAQFVVPSIGSKRLRSSTALGTSVAVASLAVFVLTGPAEAHGLGTTASVLLTTLDSCDGELSYFGRFLMLVLCAFVFCCSFALFASNTVPTKVSSSKVLTTVAESMIPRRVKAASLNSMRTV